MNSAQLQILQHCLGVDKYGHNPKGPQHPSGRNHFCAGVADEPTCRELVALGFMVQHEPREDLPYFSCSVTESGRLAMKAGSPEAPKITRAQKRYREFLDCSDVYNCTFREWLTIRKTDWYRKMKAGCDY